MDELETKVGGYEAAARECERLAEECRVKADESTADGAAAYWGGRTCSFRDAARIIREHAQHVPQVDREGLTRVLCEHAERHGDMNAPGAADAIIAHLGAQPAALPASEPAPAASRPFGDGGINPENLRALGEKLGFAAPAASEPAQHDSERVRAFVAARDEFARLAVQHPGDHGAVSSRAPVASEPAAVTDAMVDAAIDAWHERSPALLDEQMRHVLRAALAAAPQRVREVSDEDVRASLVRCGLAGGLLPPLVSAMASDFRAAGLCVAVTDTEWAALVAERDAARIETASAHDLAAKACDERDKLTDQLANAKKARGKCCESLERERDALVIYGHEIERACDEYKDQLAAATKRAEEAERDVTEWRKHLREGAALELVAHNGIGAWHYAESVARASGAGQGA